MFPGGGRRCRQRQDHVVRVRIAGVGCTEVADDQIPVAHGDGGPFRPTVKPPGDGRGVLVVEEGVNAGGDGVARQCCHVEEAAQRERGAGTGDDDAVAEIERQRAAGLDVLGGRHDHRRAGAGRQPTAGEAQVVQQRRGIDEPERTAEDFQAFNARDGRVDPIAGGDGELIGAARPGEVPIGSRIGVDDHPVLGGVADEFEGGAQGQSGQFDLGAAHLAEERQRLADTVRRFDVRELDERGIREAGLADIPRSIDGAFIDDVRFGYRVPVGIVDPQRVVLARPGTTVENHGNRDIAQSRCGTADDESIIATMAPECHTAGEDRRRFENRDRVVLRRGFEGELFDTADVRGLRRVERVARPIQAGIVTGDGRTFECIVVAECVCDHGRRGAIEELNGVVIAPAANGQGTLDVAQTAEHRADDDLVVSESPIDVDTRSQQCRCYLHLDAIPSGTADQREFLHAFHIDGRQALHRLIECRRGGAVQTYIPSGGATEGVVVFDGEGIGVVVNNLVTVHRVNA